MKRSEATSPLSPQAHRVIRASVAGEVAEHVEIEHAASVVGERQLVEIAQRHDGNALMDSFLCQYLLGLPLFAGCDLDQERRTPR